MSTALPFSFPTHSRNPYAVVALPAEIDLSNAPDIADRLITLLDSGVPGVIADMTDTSFCDSSGITAVIRAYNHARTRGARIRLVIPHPHVRKVFTITGVDQLIPIHFSLADARRAIRDAEAT